MERGETVGMNCRHGETVGAVCVRTKFRLKSVTDILTK